MARSRFVKPMALGLLGVLAVCAVPTLALTNSGGAPPARTGAPGEATCSSAGCHVDGTGGMGNLNTGPGTLTVEVPEAYRPGEPVEVQVRLAQAGRARFGFQLTVRNAQNQYVGTLERPAPDSTRFAGASTEYVTHTSRSTRQVDAAVWRMRWVPPAEDAGPVTFYAAGNASNANGSSTGDDIYTAQTTLSADVSASREDLPETLRPLTVHAAYPNPAAAFTTLTYELARPAAVSVAVFDATGRRVYHEVLGVQPVGTHGTTLDLEALPAGFYYGALTAGAYRQVQPFLIAR